MPLMPRDDQLGTLNYITPAKIAGAAALAGVAIKTYFFPNACGILQLHALRMFRENRSGGAYTNGPLFKAEPIKSIS